jgi:hypothetical protein
MVAEWYCEIEGKEHGPLTAVQLKQLATSGRLQPAHPIWKNGMHKKVPAKAVKGLFGTGRSAAATAVRDDDIVETDVVEEIVESDVIEDVIEEVEMVEEVSEVAPVAPVRAEKPKKKEKLTAAKIVAETSATYREGHPDLDGPISGTLYLEPDALRFDSDEAEFRLTFEKIENVREPAKGDFPESMKSSAMTSKIAGTAGRLASGLVGSWLGGGVGKAAARVGKEASKAAHESGNLGKRPRNRIMVIVKIRNESCQLLFDVDAESRDDMNEEAQVFYKKVQKARDKEATITAPEEAEDRSGATSPGMQTSHVANLTAPGPAAAPAPGPAAAPAASPGKPFRILCAGELLGPFSLEEVRKLIGKLGPTDMIGVECWLPAATLAGLMGGGGGKGASNAMAAVAGAAVGAAVGVGAAAALSHAGHEEHIPEVDVKPEEEAPKPKEDGEGRIPVDLDFTLD